MKVFATPLETQHFQRYSSSAEVGSFLHGLARAAPTQARVDCIGYSAARRAIHALVCGLDGETPKRRVMLVGSQHGASEAAGCEAMLYLARAVLVGELQSWLDEFELVLIPNANPDGRDLDSSRNAHDVNINRDFVLLSQPESAALDNALLRYRPQVVLDAHESASLKRKTLGREGYITDFEAQFDVANTPAIPAANRAYLVERLLPRLLAAVAAKGLRAQRYIREITSTTQPITHGGLTIRKFRNKAGLRGPLTVLLETPMEPKSGTYPSYRNIAVRVEKQFLCQRVFLECLQAERAALNTLSTDAAPPEPGQCLALNGNYVQRMPSPTVTIPLRKRTDGEPVPIVFPDHRAVTMSAYVEMPAAYVVVANAPLIAAFLARHQLRFTATDQSREQQLMANVFRPDHALEDGWRLHDHTREVIKVPAGSLLIPTSQPHGALLALLLDPRSHSSLFRYPSLARLIDTERPFFICET